MSDQPSDFWADLDSDLNAPAPGVDIVESLPEPRVWTEPCQHCRGTGKFRSYAGRTVGNCFHCKGLGTKTFRSSSESRAKGRASRDRKGANTIAKAIAWLESHPAETAWLTSRAATFDFAAQMLAALDKYGSLTEGQHAAVTRLMEQDSVRDATRAAEKAQRVAAAPSVDITAIETAFANAKATGVASPKLRLDTFKFSPAKPGGANAGAVYVKEGDTYLGKIVGGKFHRARECSPETEARVVTVASDPKQAAIAYGQRTGSCACCGRELTNHASIDLGIGPICAGRFGW